MTSNEAEPLQGYYLGMVIPSPQYVFRMCVHCFLCLYLSIHHISCAYNLIYLSKTAIS